MHLLLQHNTDVQSRENASYTGFPTSFVFWSPSACGILLADIFRTFLTCKPLSKLRKLDLSENPHLGLTGTLDPILTSQYARSCPDWLTIGLELISILLSRCLSNWLVYYTDSQLMYSRVSVSNGGGAISGLRETLLCICSHTTWFSKDIVMRIDISGASGRLRLLLDRMQELQLLYLHNTGMNRLLHLTFWLFGSCIILWANICT